MTVLTDFELIHLEGQVERWVRFGREASERILDRRRRVLAFAPGSVFAFVRWASNDYGTAEPDRHRRRAAARRPRPVPRGRSLPAARGAAAEACGRTRGTARLPRRLRRQRRRRAARRCARARSTGRPLPVWSGCIVLTDAQVFLMNPDRPDSLDGRYFGPLDRSTIAGRAEPIWTGEEA